MDIVQSTWFWLVRLGCTVRCIALFCSVFVGEFQLVSSCTKSLSYFTWLPTNKRLCDPSWFRQCSQNDYTRWAFNDRLRIGEWCWAGASAAWWGDCEKAGRTRTRLLIGRRMCRECAAEAGELRTSLATSTSHTHTHTHWSVTMAQLRGQSTPSEACQRWLWLLIDSAV